MEKKKLSLILSSRLVMGVLVGFIAFIALVVAPVHISLIFVLLVCGLAAWEWSQFALIRTQQHRIFYAAGTAAVLAFLYLLLPDIVLTQLLWLSFFLWIFLVYVVLYYPETKDYFPQVVRFYLGPLLLIQLGLAFMLLKGMHYGDFMLFYACVIVAAADTGAYYVGRRFGKKQLAPLLSVKKTWAGFCGGALLAMLIASIVFSALSFVEADIQASVFFGATALLVLFSVFGDLFESVLKRICHLKDSGTVLGDHGGVLDRIDGLIAAVPLYALFSLYLW